MSNKQHLVIDKFSELAGHLQALLDNCITNLPVEGQHGSECLMRGDGKQQYVCAIKTQTKVHKCGNAESPGVEISIF